MTRWCWTLGDGTRVDFSAEYTPQTPHRWPPGVWMGIVGGPRWCSMSYEDVMRPAQRPAQRQLEMDL